ncbi:MAG TPA: hypothetical protein VGI64_17470 [Streptosporangiaceae bacterium]
MLVAAAVCPHPPVLIPEAMGAAGLTAVPADPGADGLLAALRAECAEAVTGLLDAGADLLIAVGGGAETAEHAASAAGTLRGLGVPFSTGPGEPVLPLSLTVASWLLRLQPAGCPVILQAVAQDAAPGDCLRLGGSLASRAARVALLVLADGTARKATGVPGAADPAAEQYDAELAAALADGDAARLARLEPARDSELLATGRAPLQVLAGASQHPMRGRLTFGAAPLDVTYLVASWTLRPDHDRRAAAPARQGER